MPGFNHTTENMKTKTLLGFFLLSVMAFCVSACQDDAEIILFSGSELVDETGTCTDPLDSSIQRKLYEIYNRRSLKRTFPGEKGNGKYGNVLKT